MKRILLVAAVATLAGGAVLVRHAIADTAAPSADAVASNRALWQAMTGYITTAAEELSEADYAYRPVNTVRTFGELVGHVAGAQYMFCAAALGEPPRAEDAVEKNAKSKADLVKALKESTEYCNRAYAQSDDALGQPIKLFGQDRTRMFALVMNGVHNGEHYGNIVTYMRMKGMVPPSSRQQ
jgi:uncharacterized damage-inducible protein DinB